MDLWHHIFLNTLLIIISIRICFSLVKRILHTALKSIMLNNRIYFPPCKMSGSFLATQIKVCRSSQGIREEEYILSALSVLRNTQTDNNGERREWEDEKEGEELSIFSESQRPRTGSIAKIDECIDSWLFSGDSFSLKQYKPCLARYLMAIMLNAWDGLRGLQRGLGES